MKTTLLLHMLFVVALNCWAQEAPSTRSVGPTAHPQEHEAMPLPTENAYNPIPSPDGKDIAYVRIGWGRPPGNGGFGRSNLVSEVAVASVSGNPVPKGQVADAFLSGWTTDGTNLVCYRDGEFALVSRLGKRSSEGRLPSPGSFAASTERVTYLPRSGTMIWSRQDAPSHTALETPQGTIAQRGGWLGELIVPSPNGRYIAIAAVWADTVWIYDTELKSWAYLEDVEIHPDRDWDYIKPTWAPWFADSSRLAYFSHKHSVLSISTPDGKQRTDILINGLAGLATPSPDGLSVAFVTFEPHPRKIRPDLEFWGGTRVWVVSLSGKPEPHPVTLRSPEETYDLRWLGDHALVFDRIADVLFFKDSRIWKVDIPH